MSTTCYHGRRLVGGDTTSHVEVIAHDVHAEHRAALVHFVKHSPAGFNWGYAGSGPADLARSMLVDALGPAAMCPDCLGRQRVVWLGPDADSLPEPYDDDLHGAADPDMVTRCHCEDGIRPLPYQDFKFAVIAALPDHWRIGRAEIMAWLVGQYETVPEWLEPALKVEDVELPT